MSDEIELIEPEAEPPPKEGTLAWLQQQPHVEVLGLELPVSHRVPAGSQLASAEDEPGRCRVIRPSGDRCKATATRVYGICSGHAGGGLQDFAIGSKVAHRNKARLRARRELLGIGPSRVGNPRSHARLAALERAELLAEAIVIAPLDDASLGTIERQRAALAALDATFPLQRVDVELELPASPDEAEGLSWEAMQRLAAQLLSSG